MGAYGDAAANIRAKHGLTVIPSPVAWVEDRLGERFWSKQAEVAESVHENRKTAVHAGFSLGKSHAASRLVAWWLDTHPPGDAYVVTTAPTHAQVKAILWREIAEAHRQGGLPGRINQTEWYMDATGEHYQAPRQGQERLVAFGRSPGDATAFQGIHERFVLAVLDEAAGVSADIWDAAEGLVANENSRMLAIGNPDAPTGRFAKVCTPGSGWNVIQLGAFDSPAFTEERHEFGPEVLDRLVSETWVEERRKDWGEGSPLWQSRVLGEFPDAGEDNLVAVSWCVACQQREPEGGDVRVLGVDVARFGSDDTVWVLRDGDRLEVVDVVGRTDMVEVAGRTEAIARDLGLTEVRVDGTGVGGGVVDVLNDNGNLSVVDMVAGGKAIEADRFVNARAEWFWLLREDIEARDITLPGGEWGDRLVAELTALKWTVDSRGRIKVVGKDEMKRKGLGSPDVADAGALAWAGVVVDEVPLVVPGGVTGPSYWKGR